MAPPRSSTAATPRRGRGSSTLTTGLICLAVIAVAVYGVNYYNNNMLKQTVAAAKNNQTPNLQNDAQWKRELLARLDRIRASCGELCNMNNVEQMKAHHAASPNKKKDQKNSNFDSLQANVDCSAIIGNEDIDASDWSFPSTIPDDLMPLFTLDGVSKFEAVKIYKHQYQGGLANSNKWTEADLEDKKNQAMKDMPTIHGTYSPRAVRMVREKLRLLNLAKKSVLVIGSENPWVEAICLGLGAAQVTTLEYGSIESTHPQVKTLTPAAFRALYQADTLGQFDVIVSHSSLEHSGLGRYGDAFNPWGDILALARAWCVTKPGGTLYLGLPTGKDKIVFNAHRVYGKVRWPLITTNWEQIDAYNHTDDEFEVNAGIDVMYGGTGLLFRKPN